MRVPKRADHEQRRQQIADALLRVAATRGLHAAGMREVAAEAGVSLRLVQYYFGTKEELLLAAMQHLAARFSERAVARFRQASGSGGPASPRDVIAAILAEALPADDDRRTFYVVYTAYLALSLTDPALAIAPLVKNSDAVTVVVAAQLRAAQAADDTPAHLNPDLEALSLMAMSAGLATSVLVGQSSIQQAQAVIDYHLERLFLASRPALYPAPMKLPVTSRRAAHRTDQPKDAAVTTGRQGGGLSAFPPAARASSRNRQLSQAHTAQSHETFPRKRFVKRFTSRFCGDAIRDAGPAEPGRHGEPARHSGGLNRRSRAIRGRSSRPARRPRWDGRC